MVLNVRMGSFIAGKSGLGLHIQASRLMNPPDAIMKSTYPVKTIVDPIVATV